MMLMCLMFGLFLSLGYATGLQRPNLDIWDLDVSCQVDRPVLQKACNDVAILAHKALEDIKYVRQPQPDESEPQERAKWDHIPRAVRPMFSFTPNAKGLLIQMRTRGI